ncbi:hypothetical protein KDI_04450 [Dictyobacter arantiisoli]|uniref:Uncharacterized protein n=1 Tax=Dictyobacter arantiisoli TaxID=2014874 RepID=A0A5A5T613_9CHLR|nr:hypothetical protein KDI_04450 [Dictyobacter arantiisoli]
MGNADASVGTTLHGWRGIAIAPQSPTSAGGKSWPSTHKGWFLRMAPLAFIPLHEAVW